MVFVALFAIFCGFRTGQFNKESPRRRRRVPVKLYRVPRACANAPSTEIPCQQPGAQMETHDVCFWIPLSIKQITRDEPQPPQPPQPGTQPATPSPLRSGSLPQGSEAHRTRAEHRTQAPVPRLRLSEHSLPSGAGEGWWAIALEYIRWKNMKPVGAKWDMDFRALMRWS